MRSFEGHDIVRQTFLDKLAVMHKKCTSAVCAFYYGCTFLFIQFVRNFIIFYKPPLFINYLSFSSESLFSHKLKGEYYMFCLIITKHIPDQ